MRRKRNENQVTKKDQESKMPDLRLSEIKAKCKKQKSCENCDFVFKIAGAGVCMVCPIGTTPANWNIEEETESTERKAV